MPEDAKVLKLYMVKDEYITDLHDNVDEHVFANIDPRYNHSRKYLGVLLVINGFKGRLWRGAAIGKKRKQVAKNRPAS